VCTFIITEKPRGWGINKKAEVKLGYMEELEETCLYETDSKESPSVSIKCKIPNILTDALMVKTTLQYKIFQAAHVNVI
jgi:hypothetical protein